VPLGAGEQIREALLDHFEHDVHRDGCAGRRSEQRGNAARRIGDDLGAVVDDARLAVRLFDRLHADAGIDQFPIRSLRGGIENVQHLSVEFLPLSGGLATDKKSLREQMADAAVEVASATSAYAKKTKNKDLAAKVNYSRSDMTGGRDTAAATA